MGDITSSSSFTAPAGGVRVSGADGGGSYFSSGGEPGHIHSSNDVYGYGYGYGDSFGISSTRLPNGTYSY